MNNLTYLLKHNLNTDHEGSNMSSYYSIKQEVTNLFLVCGDIFFEVLHDLRLVVDFLLQFLDLSLVERCEVLLGLERILQLCHLHRIHTHASPESVQLLLEMGSAQAKLLRLPSRAALSAP